MEKLASGPSFAKAEGLQIRPWRQDRPPGNILVIRFQAFGDVVISLPYLKGLKKALPGSSRLDFLTRQENVSLPRALGVFGRVHSLRGGRNPWAQRLAALSLWPRLRRERYEVIIDLQRNGISRWLRRQLQPVAWCAFDRYAPCWAGQRYHQAIQALQLVREIRWEPIGCGAEPTLPLPEDTALVVLNPAGFFPSRNWPLENYLELATLLQDHFKNRVRFVVLGLPRLKEKADFLAGRLGECCMNLVGRTTPTQALAVLERASLVVSEDSGLAHLAWAADRPLLLLLGSSFSAWSAPPLGERVRCLDSRDLPCGGCLQPLCRYGDVHCLTRYSPRQVFEQCLALLASRAIEEGLA